MLPNSSIIVLMKNIFCKSVSLVTVLVCFCDSVGELQDPLGCSLGEDDTDEHLQYEEEGW